jgi:uncharacterized membrane protein
MWANLFLLFCLSLFPFATAWAGHQHFAPLPKLVYGGVLLGSALAYFLLQTVIVAGEGGPNSPLGKALGRDPN